MFAASIDSMQLVWTTTLHGAIPGPAIDFTSPEHRKPSSSVLKQLVRASLFSVQLQ